MRRFLYIWVFVFIASVAAAQEGTRVIDSLENALAVQQGREKVETMIELSKAFFDFSFDDCINWSEKAIQLSKEMGDSELEADACYSIGVHYGYHSDLDLARVYLKQSFDLYQRSGNENKAFEALWNQAYFELVLGNMDTAYAAFQEVKSMAERRHDSLACAQASANLAIAQYQRDDIESSINSFLFSKAYYEALHDTTALAEVDMNLATLYSECGRSSEARELFVSVMPLLEAYRNYDFLLLAYKNYGILFARDLINYDSANYYFEKALSVTEREGLSRQDRQTMTNTKADVLTELGNVACAQRQFLEATKYYEQALSLAEGNGYHFGIMQAVLGLGQLYAQQGQAAKSLHYLERYAEEASRSGITMMDASVKKSLIMDYARLGRYSEMGKELDELDEQRAALTRENADISNRIRELRGEVDDLLVQYDSQSAQIQALQSQCNHYRLAFFGLLAIALFALVLLVVYKIVRKKRAKTKKG